MDHLIVLPLVGIAIPYKSNAGHLGRAKLRRLMGTGFSSLLRGETTG
jgi:hypothetical protein